MYHQAFQCYVLAALQNDPDGEAGVAVMEMNGIAPGKKMPDDQIRTLLDDSALSDSYAALIGEREAFAQGLLGSKKDPENMKYWQVKADTWAVREKAGMHVPPIHSVSFALINSTSGPLDRAARERRRPPAYKGFMHAQKKAHIHVGGSLRTQRIVG